MVFGVWRVFELDNSDRGSVHICQSTGFNRIVNKLYIKRVLRSIHQACGFEKRQYEIFVPGGSTEIDASIEGACDNSLPTNLEFMVTDITCVGTLKKVYRLSSRSENATGRQIS